MASIIQQMKKNVMFKFNNLISNPEADAYAKKEEDIKKKEAEQAVNEKLTTERIERQKTKSKKESEKLLKTDPGVHRIESIYVKQNKQGDDEEYVDVSWKAWPNGNKDNNYVAKKKDFDAFVNSVDPELLKGLYVTYEREQKNAEERVKKANFSVERLAKTSWDTFLSIFFATVKILLGILAVSFATNLNLYKQWTYRLLYAVFAYRFWFVVIPYVLLYRWAWLKKQPKFYSLIPLVPLRFENRLMAQFFSWLSYKPDDEIDAQREWLTWKKERESKDTEE